MNGLSFNVNSYEIDQVMPEVSDQDRVILHDMYISGVNGLGEAVEFAIASGDAAHMAPAEDYLEGLAEILHRLKVVDDSLLKRVDAVEDQVYRIAGRKALDEGAERARYDNSMRRLFHLLQESDKHLKQFDII